MIKKLLLVSLFSGIISANAQQVLNPGFENWTAGNPNGWGSFSQMLAPLGITGTNLEVQTATAHSGTSAVLLTNQTVPLVGVVAGTICTGPMTLDPTTGRVTFLGQPYTFRPTSLDFWYQYVPATPLGDTAYALALFTKWNTTTNKRDTLGGAGSNLFDAATYTQNVMPVFWMVPTTVPDSVLVLFISSIAGTAPVGSALYIDDVNFTLPVGIQSLDLIKGEFTLYPNPASSELNLVANDETAKTVVISDITGRKITELELTNKQAKISLINYSEGVYFYSMLDANNTVLHTSKFVVVK